MSSSGVKHGLCLCGGGAKGAYQAGAAAAIGEYYRNTSSPITVLSGTSVGALNAAAIAAKGWHYPLDLWWNVSDDQVYRKSKLLFLWRVWQLGSIYDSEPLWRFIKAAVDPKAIQRSQFDLYVHTTELGHQRPVVFTGKDPDILTGVFASASIPGAFPPVKWRGHWLVDGGTVDNSPIRSLIRAGCDRITVIHLDDELPADPIMADDVTPLPDSERPRIHQTLGCSIEAMMDAHFQRDLKNLKLINMLVENGCPPKPTHRKIAVRVFNPKKDLGDTLNFDTKRMRAALGAGYSEGRAWVRAASAR